MQFALHYVSTDQQIIAAGLVYGQLGFVPTTDDVTVDPIAGNLAPVSDPTEQALAPRSARTNLHHSDPKFMGGDPNQPLTKMDVTDHIQLHQDLNDFLENEIDSAGHNMRPTTKNSGQQIRDNFTRDERLDALKRFYQGPGATYSDAAKAFFDQHPELI